MEILTQNFDKLKIKKLGKNILNEIISRINILLLFYTIRLKKLYTNLYIDELKIKNNFLKILENSYKKNLIHRKCDFIKPQSLHITSQ